MKRLIFVAILCPLAVAAFLPAASVQGDDRGRTSKNVTFCKDVAPILQQHCTRCHHDGGIAPMPLETYKDVRPWAAAIREAILEHKMPPFHASGPQGYFIGDPRLSPEEVATISKWVDANGPMGRASDMPAPRVWKDDWTAGKPNIELSMPSPFLVKPERKDDYAFFVLSHVFAEDTWIRGVEVKPGNVQAVHHVNVYILPASEANLPAGRVDDVFDPVKLGATFYVAWEPGCSPLIYPAGVAALIPKGSRLAMQVHYAPTAVPLTDQTLLGVHLADGVIEKQARTLYGGTKTLDIPPGAADHQVVEQRKVPEDAIITGFTCHLHLRGKSFQLRLHYPDNRVETAFEVPRFDPNWQEVYQLARPIKVPKGTVAEYVATWDNTSKNRLNPDPNKLVHWGDRVEDEMMDGYLYYLSEGEKLELQVKGGIASNKK